jgi:hypothetical protein
MNDDPAKAPTSSPSPRWAGVALLFLAVLWGALSGLCFERDSELPLADQVISVLLMPGLIALVGIFLMIRRWER